MKVRKGLLPIFVVNVCIILFFAAYFIRSSNYEFIIYVGVIAFFLGVFAFTRDRVYFPNYVLWLLTFWALLHLAGGSVRINGTLLYHFILIPLSQTAPIFRYDQFVHIVGFGTATFVMYYMLRPLLKPDVVSWRSLSIVIISAGLGVGAFNEIVEFIVTVFLPETNVGGYLNTALDLVSNFIGAIGALVFIRLKAARDFVSG